MNKKFRFYKRWLERKIEARALRDAGFDRAWALRAGCLLSAATVLLSHLAVTAAGMLLILIYVGIFESDRDVLTTANNITIGLLGLWRHDQPLPYIYLLLILVGGMACMSFVMRVKRRVLQRLNRCTHCGYPLANPNQTVCPECGKEAERPTQEQPTRSGTA